MVVFHVAVVVTIDIVVAVVAVVFIVGPTKFKVRVKSV